MRVQYYRREHSDTNESDPSVVGNVDVGRIHDQRV